jgi:integrase
VANVLAGNPVRDVAAIKSRRPPTGAPALSVEQLRELLTGLHASDYCREYDLADPFTLLIATGLRRGELLGLRWTDYDESRGTLTVCGKVVRVTGQGLIRDDATKSVAGRRTIALPQFAIEALAARRKLPFYGEHPGDHVPVDGGHLARSEQLRPGLAEGPCRARRSRGHHTQFPQDRGHFDRRSGPVGAHRC